jgi:hypothetical protein
MGAKKADQHAALWTRRTMGLATASAWVASGALESAHAQEDDGWTPFEYIYGIRLRGQLNGREARILLDSGASNAALDRTAAQRFGISVSDRTTPLRGFGASREVAVSAPFVLVVPSQSLDVRYNIQGAVLADFSALISATEPFDLILGRHAFENFFVDIDFDHQRLAFRRSLSAAARRSPHVRLLPTAETLRALDVSIGESAPFKAIFDLGSTSTLSVSSAFAAERDLLAGLRASRWVAAGIDGVTEYDIATTPSVHIGPLHLTNMPIEVDPAWSSDVPGNLGYEALSQFSRIITDYRNDRLYVTSRAGPQRPFRKNRSGIAAVREGDRCRVVFVAPSSPAAGAGWRVGDEFIALNGVPIAQAHDRLWGNAAAGAKVVLTMADGAARTLELREYY